jgi:hypothetical protein
MLEELQGQVKLLQEENKELKLQLAKKEQLEREVIKLKAEIKKKVVAPKKAAAKKTK